MNKIGTLFAIVIGAGVFVYLVSSFLVATLDITLWKDEQRFFTAVVYLMSVWGIPQLLADPSRYSAFKKKPEEPKQEVVQSEKQLQEA